MTRRSDGPWFRSSKGSWYATVGGKSVNLRVRGEQNRSAAELAWHRLLARGGEEVEQQPKPKVNSAPDKKEQDTTVSDLFRIFLATKKGVIQDRTLITYTYLSNWVTKRWGSCSASELKGYELTAWLQSLPVSANTKHDIGGILSSLYKWAECEGLIQTNPMKKLKRPSRVSRGADSVLGPKTYEKLLATASKALKRLITVLYETGARPSELRRLEAQHCDFENSVAILTEHKTAHTTGKPRLIVLSETAVEILKGQAQKYPKGPLLRNSFGEPWGEDTVTRAFYKLSRKIGVKVICYSFRHDFATTALANGVPDATVAALLGHSNTTMLHKHYSHLTSQSRVLREALGKVRLSENKETPDQEGQG